MKNIALISSAFATRMRWVRYQPVIQFSGDTLRGKDHLGDTHTVSTEISDKLTMFLKRNSTYEEVIVIDMLYN